MFSFTNHFGFSDNTSTDISAISTYHVRPNFGVYFASSLILAHACPSLTRFSTSGLHSIGMMDEGGMDIDMDIDLGPLEQPSHAQILVHKLFNPTY